MSSAAARARRRRRFHLYLQRLAALTIVFCGCALLLNLFVDPLWYWRGNQITGRNFPFNERLSRVNLLLQDPDRYDCLIFGSSRVGLLDQTKIAGHRCFTVTFSAGSVVEFVDYARYLKQLGLRPRLLIVGVDDYNFLPGLMQPPATPEFVRRHEAPPGILASYLSLGAMRLSLRTLLQQSDESRYYDAGFVGHVLESAPRFVPPRQLGDASEAAAAFEPHRARLYRRLRESFPEAAFWGYVPPISAWDVAEDRYATGHLTRYLQAVWETAAWFDRFYDFSAPCPMTQRRDNTYDGSHYFPWVNAIVAERLQSGSQASPADGFGLPLHALSRAAYVEAFTSRVTDFVAAASLKLGRVEPPSKTPVAAGWLR